MTRFENVSGSEGSKFPGPPAPIFTTNPFVSGPPLSQRRVAIVTTGGLHTRNDRPFLYDDADYYRIIPGNIQANDLFMSHFSSGFDRSAFQRDCNVIFPIDRLREMAEEGIIGNLADFHYSFRSRNARESDPEPIREIAGFLKKDKVDAVLLFPVWPGCTHAVGVLSHFIEEEGVPTAGISSNRSQTEAIKPPRALWVPFELGHPLGAPNNIPFQRRVLMALMNLLKAPEGPILADFPDNEPESEDEFMVLSCPVDFTLEAVESGETDQLQAALHREMTGMRPWYDMGVEKRQRTTVGVSGIDINELGEFIYAFVKGIEPENPRDDMTLPFTLKLAVEDLKAYYMEGITAQPGQEGVSSKTLKDWFWDDTAAGKVLTELVKICIKSPVKELSDVAAHYLAPLDIIQRMKQ